MAGIDEVLAEIERANYDYRIVRHVTHDRGVDLSVEITLPGALFSPSIKLHRFASATDTAHLAEALADALAQIRHMSQRIHRGEEV